MKLLLSYQAADFQAPQLFKSNFTEVSIRHPKNDYDVIMTSPSQYLVFKIAHFVELNRNYHPVKFQWPRLSGSNFTKAGGKHPSDLLSMHHFVFYGNWYATRWKVIIFKS